MDIEPRAVFDHFQAVTAIPRGSGGETAFGDFLLAFARERGLEGWRDAAGNVLIRKAAGPGGSGAAPVIVQAHMDMVWESDRAVDFAATPPRLIRDGDWLRADGTTLGADNGIGLAYCLALLAATDIAHPPLEALFTVAEETGMHGAKALDISGLAGERLINLDSEEEGVLYASCAGGARLTVVIPAETTPLPDGEWSAWEVAIDGLRGGHSGTEIDADRGNANRLLGRVLASLAGAGIGDWRLAGVEGGRVDNAIPARSRAAVVASRADAAALRAVVARWDAVFREELAAGDPGVRVSLTEAAAMPERVMGEAARERVVAALVMIPHGVEAWEWRMGGGELVETSQNFAVVRTEGEAVCCTVSLRSSRGSGLAWLETRMGVAAGLLGGKVEAGERYPGWEFAPESRLREVFSGLRVKGIHAGLECGVFAEKYRQAGRVLDMVSIGPDIRDAHTPEERVSIASTARVWETLKAALKALCTE